MSCKHEVEHLIGTSEGILCKKCHKVFKSFTEIELDRVGKPIEEPIEEPAKAEEPIEEPKEEAPKAKKTATKKTSAKKGAK